jgi:drug/metabolite transporter (DMT)-like permease
LERGYHSLTITFYTFFIASASSVFLCDIRRVAAVAAESGSMLVFSCAFGVLCTVVPYLFYTMGLNYVENSKASILASVEPITAAILGIIFFHESITVSEIIGILLVVGAFAL